MFYADDAVFVGQWCDDNINTLVHVLEYDFFLASGITLNMSKSKIMGFMLEIVLAAKEKGGLGVSSLFALNRALLMKWFWRFYSHNDSLWSRVIKAILRIDGLGVGVVDELNEPSLDNNFRRSIRGGIEQSQFKKLTDLLIPIVLNPCPDRWFWSLEGSGEFSVASIRRFIDQRLWTVDSKTLCN
ncbi:hypothetical protein Tco_1448879 [Tanacetum coccineum]